VSDSKAPPTEIPVEMLRALNLEGRARFGRLTFDGMEFADVDVSTNAGGGRVKLDPWNDKKGARLSILRSAIVPLPGSNVQSATAGSSLRVPQHSTEHVGVRFSLLCLTWRAVLLWREELRIYVELTCVLRQP